MANYLCVPERKSINWLSLEIFTSLPFTFYPIGSVCLIEFFSLGQNQSDRHEISVYTEKLCSFLFSCLSKLNTLNFSHLQHACPEGMLLVLFAEKWCWIKEHNSSLGILHFPTLGWLSKISVLFSTPSQLCPNYLSWTIFVSKALLSSVSPMGIPGLPLWPGNAVSECSLFQGK